MPVVFCIPTFSYPNLYLKLNIMDYFFMTDSADSKIVGKFPQLEKMFDGFNALRRFEVWGLHSELRKTPMENISGFQLKHHSKLTDWISFVQVGFGSALISERFHTLLQNFDCMPSISVDSEVNYQKNTYHYKFLYFPEVFNQFIDFKKTRFFIGSTNKWEADVSIHSFEQFKAASAELEEIRVRTGKIRSIKILELYFNSSKTNKDFFKISNIVNYIVSARLKDAIIENGITGVEFTPAQGYKAHVMDSHSPNNVIASYQ